MQPTLARYVCHRKAVLKFLEKQLEIRDDGRYRREDRIHNIIFPMGKTSDDVPLDGHNLWLIDEKLAYHAFLGLGQATPFASAIELPQRQGARHPRVRHSLLAFVPAIDPPYPAVVIVEFKRPMRNDFDANENPFVQVLGYISDLRSKKARTPRGAIEVKDQTPFYCESCRHFLLDA